MDPTMMAHDDGNHEMIIHAWFDVEKEDSGSYRLVLRCRREYGWRHEWALKVLQGYRQFLTLHRLVLQQERAEHNQQATRKEQQDLVVDSRQDDDKNRQQQIGKVIELLPSVSIRKMWKQHVLDMTHYAQDCQTLVGRLVPFDVDDVVEVKHCETQQEQENYQQRALQTRQVLEAHFSIDQINPHIWKNLYLDSHNHSNNKDSHELIELKFTLDQQLLAGASSSPTTMLTLLVFRNVPLQRVFRRLARRIQTPHSNLKFINAPLGNPLVGTATPELMGWYGQHIIQVYLKSERLLRCVHRDNNNVQQLEEVGGGPSSRVPQSWTAMMARRQRPPQGKKMIRIHHGRTANDRAVGLLSNSSSSNIMTIQVEISKDRILNVKCPLLGRMKRVYIKVALELKQPINSFRLFQNGMAVPHTKRIKNFNPQAGKLTIEDAQTQDDNEVMLDQFATTTLSENH